MRAGLPGTPEVPIFLKENLPAKARVGIDPQVHSATAARTLRAALEEGGHSLVSLRENLVDKARREASGSEGTPSGQNRK